MKPPRSSRRCWIVGPHAPPVAAPRGGSCSGPTEPDPRKSLGYAGGVASWWWSTRVRLSLFGPLRSVGLRSERRHSDIGAPDLLGVRARRAEGGGRPCGPTALRSSVRGRAVHLAPRAARVAHDAGESDHEARCARRPRPCGPRRLPRPAAPAPQAALLQGRGVPRPCPHPGPLPQAGEGDRRSGRRSAFARACLQRCGQAGRGARGRRSAQARGVGPQGRPPPSRVAAGLPAPLSRQCKHVCFEVARPTATGRKRASALHGGEALNRTEHE